MIKGILALFKTGIIFDPFVLLGIFMGLFVALAPNQVSVRILMEQKSFYLLILLLAFLYNYLLKKVYKDDGFTLDYMRMLGNIVLSVVKFVVAAAFSFVFILMLFAF